MKNLTDFHKMVEINQCGSTPANMVSTLPSLCTVFSSPYRSIHSVTYPRQTGGKRLTFSLGPRDPKHFGLVD